MLAVGVAAAVLLWRQSGDAEGQYVLETAVERDIVLNTVATGSVLPRVEVAVKPSVGGILETLHVKPGDVVRVGQPIADLRVVPDTAQVASARAAVQEARIRLSEAERDHGKLAALAGQGAVSSGELDTAATNLSLRRSQHTASLTNLAIVRDGAAQKHGARATEVQATVAGMVLELPVEAGSTVIEANAFNEGTTIATLADMSDLLFVGVLDELEVGRVHEGMQIVVTLAAWPDQELSAVLERIAPKGQDVQGAVQFEIQAALSLPQDGRFVRAGMSANAMIELDRRAGVVALREGALQFDQGKPFVELGGGDAGVRRQDLTLGLSDGIYVEVVDGLGVGAEVRRPAL